MKSLLLCIFVVVALAAAKGPGRRPFDPHDMTFDDNFTEKEYKHKDMQYRDTKFFILKSIGIWISTYVETEVPDFPFFSFSASGSDSKPFPPEPKPHPKHMSMKHRHPTRIEQDVVIGSVSGTKHTPPYSVVGYLIGNYSGHPYDPKILHDAQDWIATCYYSLSEIDPDGNVVKTFNLSTDDGWTMSDASSSSEEERLHYITLTHEINKAEVTITWIVSEVAGKLSVGNTPITPKTLESVLRIKGWEYDNANNSVQLKMGVASTSASFNGNVLISKKKESSLFFTLNNEVIVNETNITEAIVSKYAIDPKISFGLIVDALIQANIGDPKNTLRSVNVTFPAGADDITYDPAVGEGDATYGGSAASTLSVAFTWICLIFLFNSLF